MIDIDFVKDEIRILEAIAKVMEDNEKYKMAKEDLIHPVLKELRGCVNPSFVQRILVRFDR